MTYLSLCDILFVELNWRIFKMNELKEYFFNHFKNKDELKAQYGIFTDIIIPLVDCLTDELSYFITKDNIDHLINTKIRFLERSEKVFKDTKINAVPEMFKHADGACKDSLKVDYMKKINLDKVSINDLSTTVYIFTPKEINIPQKEIDNLKNLDDLLALFPHDGAQIDTEYKQDTFIKVVIHELMHAICRRESFLLDQNDKEKKSDKSEKIDIVTLDDIKNSRIATFVGNIHDMTRIYNENGECDGVIFYEEGTLIHEGFTEFLACFIVNSSKHINSIRKNSRLIIEPVYPYCEYAHLAKIINTTQNNLVLKTYFQDANTTVDNRKLWEIRSWNQELLLAENDFSKIDNNSSIKDIRKIINSYLSVIYKPVNDALVTISGQKITKEKKEHFCKNIKNYLTLSKWINLAIKKTNNVNEKTIEKLKEEMKTTIIDLYIETEIKANNMLHVQEPNNPTNNKTK